MSKRLELSCQKNYNKNLNNKKILVNNKPDLTSKTINENKNFLAENVKSISLTSEKEQQN